jgi:hypothetical protein
MSMPERYMWVATAKKKKHTMHLAAFKRNGQFDGAMCGINLDFNRSCNLPLGQPICKRCRKAEARVR